MRNIKLTIEYDGSKYLGWQRLGDSDKTIQGKIESILTKMTGEPIEIIGSGRTDAGTHARGQVANFHTDSHLAVLKIRAFLNHYLPQDIVVKQVVEMPERYHARYHATGKKYSYSVWNAELPSPLERSTSFHYQQPLNQQLIEEACRLLEGTHDFIGFSSLKKTKKNTVRTIEEISVQQQGERITFTFVGDGFLYNMVRILMGTILEIGAGERPLASITTIFETKVRQQAGITVPAHALCLEEVYYD